MARQYYFTKNTDDEGKNRIVVDKSLRPEYYDKFKCYAQNCKINCCTGFQITMNRNDYLNIHKQPCSQQLNELIKQNICKLENSENANDYAEIRDTCTKFCPLTTEDGLCRLQLECGYDALPEICKLFPRTKKYALSGYIEYGLNPSCEAVLDLLWDLPEGIGFIEEPLPIKDQKVWTIEESTLLKHFREIRFLCIDVFQDRRFSLSHRILLIGFLLKRLPETADGVAKWLEQSRSLLQSADIVNMVSNLMQSTESMSLAVLINNIKILRDTPTTSTTIENYRNELLSTFILDSEDLSEENINPKVDIELYNKCKKSFMETFGNIEYFFENIMVTFFYQLSLPNLFSKETAWESYIKLCNIYSYLRFMSYISCRKSFENPKDELFESIIFVSKTLIHSDILLDNLNEWFYKTESTSLAYMAILLCE